ANYGEEVDFWEAVCRLPADAARHLTRYNAEKLVEMHEKIDRYDPKREALVLIERPVTSNRLGERAAFGPRRPDWVDLERKVRTDEVNGAEIAIVELAGLDRVQHIAEDLDEGHGTVWSGDPRVGVGMGGRFVRRIRNEKDAAAAYAFFSEKAAGDVIRVSPFVEGMPCSVHGIVTADDVVVFRPVEQIVLRHGTNLSYVGASTFWDPSFVDRYNIRKYARRVGEYLRDAHDFRGTFTLDGILSEHGFVANEVNPRPGAAMGYVEAVLPEFPSELVQHALVEGFDVLPDALEMEQFVLDHVDERRWSKVAVPTRRGPDELQVLHLFGSKAARRSEQPDIRVAWSASRGRGSVAIAFDPDHYVPGKPIAPMVVKSLLAARNEWNTKFRAPRYEAAQEVVSRHARGLNERGGLHRNINDFFA
ncbi:MAG: ATP-grasp domain-containing protein, partial [Acidimicrobiia bacterium]